MTDTLTGAVIVAVITLLAVGNGYAADPITLIGSGTVGRPSSGYAKMGPDGIVIDTRS